MYICVGGRRYRAKMVSVLPANCVEIWAEYYSNGSCDEDGVEYAYYLW